jgi:hypothetical protein
MAKIITASIDLAKIDKSKIVTTDKNGNPFANGAKYLNVQISLNDEADQYGNTVAISINQSKAEREAGEKRIYLGNGKVTWESDNTSTHTAKPYNETPTAGSNSDVDQLPF